MAPRKTDSIAIKNAVRAREETREVDKLQGELNLKNALEAERNDADLRYSYKWVEKAMMAAIGVIASAMLIGLYNLLIQGVRK